MRFVLTVLTALSLSFSTVAQADNSSAYEGLMSFADEKVLDLENQALVLRFMLASMDNLKAVNEALGLDMDTVTLPKSVAGIFLLGSAVPATNKVRRMANRYADFVVKSKSEKAWIRAFEAANKEVNTIQKALKSAMSADDAAILAKHGWKEAAQKMIDRNVLHSDQFARYAAAQNELMVLAKTKPKVKFTGLMSPKAVRTAIKATVFIGGVAVVATIAAEGVLLAFPGSAEDMAADVSEYLTSVESQLASL